MLGPVGMLTHAVSNGIASRGKNLSFLNMAMNLINVGLAGVPLLASHQDIP